MPFTLYRRGSVWHYRGTVAGRKIRRSTGTDRRETAQRIAAEAEARAWKCHTDGPASVLTFAQAAVLYIDAGRPRRFLDIVAAYWRDTIIRDIRAAHVRQGALDTYPHATNATRNRQFIVPTRAVINHAADLDLCPPIRIKRLPVERREKRPVTWAWIQAFMAHARTPEIGALACFLFLTGARISEALAVRWADVDMAGEKVLIRSTKTGTENWADMPPVLCEALGGLAREGENVFPFRSRYAPRHDWDATITAAGIEPLSFHACRHGFATALLQAGVDPVTVAKLGRWASRMHVVETYGHATDDRSVVRRITGT